MEIIDTPKMNDDLAAKIKTLVHVLKLKQHQAACVLNLNQGRVSEVVTGKRFADVAPCPVDQLCLD